MKNELCISSEEFENAIKNSNEEVELKYFCIRKVNEKDVLQHEIQWHKNV